MLPMIPLPLRLAFFSAACSLIAQPLPGTQPLTWEGDLDVRMMDGAHRFVERRIAESVTTRHRHWRRDATNYDDSVAPNRGRFLKNIGSVDPLASTIAMERFGDDVNQALV